MKTTNINLLTSSSDKQILSVKPKCSIDVKKATSTSDLSDPNKYPLAASVSTEDTSSQQVLTRAKLSSATSSFLLSRSDHFMDASESKFEKSSRLLEELRPSYHPSGFVRRPVSVSQVEPMQILLGAQESPYKEMLVNIYQNFHILNDSSFDPKVILICGSTGAGKSTLANYLLGKDLIAEPQDNSYYLL